MDQALIETIVRVTVRLSAVVFLMALMFFAIGARSQRGLVHARRFFAAFIAVHTVHFAAVSSLAAVTASANIDDRGGWPVAIVVATLFYASAFAILGSWRGAAAGRGSTASSRFGSGLGVLFIAAVFLNSYIARVERMPVYWIPTVIMVVVVGLYLVRVPRSSAPRTSSSWRIL
jgi:hypothetical protein